MTVTITKPQATLRELLAGLKKRTGLFGEQIIRSETATDFYSVIGNNRNVLINGSMDIWQRGTSWAGGSDNDIYTADRWHFQRYAANGISITQQSATDIGFNYCLRIGRTSGNTDTTAYYLNQPVEGLNSKRCLGKWVTFSFWIRTGSEHKPGDYFKSSICYHINASYPNDGMYYSNFRQASGSSAQFDVDLRNKAGTTWKRFEQTAFIPANAVQVGVAIGSAGNGTATSNDYFEVTGLQLEIGTTATPFEYRQVGQELALCQRYFQVDKAIANYNVFGTGTTYTGSYNEVYKQFLQEMRTSPTITFSAFTDFYLLGANEGVLTSIGAAYTNTKGTRIAMGKSGTANGQAVMLSGVNTNATIFYNAEL